MPPKDQKVGKKELAKKQKQVVEDKTFGLKNKNKSKAVQKYVAEVTKGAKMAGMSKDDFVRKQKEAEERNEKKAAKKDREAEMRMLFAPVVTKKEKEAARLAKEAAAEAAKKKAEEGPEIMDAQEAYNDARRADDLAKAEAVLGADQDDDIYTQIEKERAELKKTGILTPVTFDSFVAWKERKARERQAKELEESRQAAMKAAKEMRGKSGRELMAQLAALGSELLDDDEADDDWMVREKDSDDEEVYDIQVTGTTFSLSKVEKDKKGGAAAAGAACGAADAEEAGAPEPSAADKLAGAVDASDRKSVV